MLRPFRFADGQRGELPLAIEFDAGRIARIDDGTGGDLPIARLEPPQVGSLFPSHGEDRLILSPDGTPLPPECVGDSPSDQPPQQWSESLTGMRRTMLANTSARLVLGGRTQDYRGAMPGIAEETQVALEGRQPVYLLGGFGGCTRDIAESMDLVEPWQPTIRHWDGRAWFENNREFRLNNGLTIDENRQLVRTPHIDEAVLLALTGLERIQSTFAEQS